MKLNQNVQNFLFSSIYVTAASSGHMMVFVLSIKSILGIFLVAQIVTGLFLVIHYCSNVITAFDRVRHICRDVNYRWLLRTLHANGASLFFVSIYLHTGRNLYYGSHNFIHTWSIGVVILFLTIATAFIGYVLPWGQISFWGATVITNLLSAIPYVGGEVLQWVWGGFAVDNATLTRFFALHFLIPFVIKLNKDINEVILRDLRSYWWWKQRLKSFRRPYQTCCLHLLSRQQVCLIRCYPFTEACGGTCDHVQLWSNCLQSNIA